MRGVFIVKAVYNGVFIITGIKDAKEKKLKIYSWKNILERKRGENTQPTQADLTEDLQIFDADCDDNGYFTLILILLDCLQCMYGGHIIYGCQHFYLRKGISATLNFFRFSDFIL